MKRSVLRVGLLLLAAAVLRAQPHDAEWRFGNSGDESYVLEFFTPPEAGLGLLDGHDPELRLRLGWRYRVVVTDPQKHPIGRASCRERV